MTMNSVCTLATHRQKPVHAWDSASATPPMDWRGWLGILILALMAAAPIALMVHAHLREQPQRQRSQQLLQRTRQELNQAYLDLAAARAKTHRRLPNPPRKEP